MAELSVAHRMALAAVVESCPDAVLPRLASAVTSMRGDRAEALARMLAIEARDRTRRSCAFAPLLPMFRPRRDGLAGLSFPRPVLPRLWKVAASREPALLARLDDDNPDQIVVADRICVAAAAAVRDHADGVWPPSLSPDARDEGLTQLAACFDLAHLARRDLATLDAWVSRPDPDQVAELRLLLRDAADVSPDGAERMLEILFAHIDDAVLVTRLLTQASTASNREGFLSGSEMSGFVDRLVTGLEERTARVAGFRPSADLKAVDGFLADVNWCTTMIGEMDLTVRPSSGSAWGKTTRDSRLKVAAQLTAMVKSSRKGIEKALPMARMALTGRMTRLAPKLDAPIDGDVVSTARSLAALVGGLRGPAAVFGCESERSRMVEGLSDYLFTHADQGLEMINSGMAPDEGHALALLELDAELLTLVGAADTARTVRRRAAVAGGVPPVDAESRSAA